MYILTIDSNSGHNFCALEADGIKQDRLVLLLEGFFADGGTFHKVDRVPSNPEYVSQSLYLGKLDELGIDNVFSIKSRKKSTVLVITQKT